MAKAAALLLACATCVTGLSVRPQIQIAPEQGGAPIVIIGSKDCDPTNGPCTTSPGAEAARERLNTATPLEPLATASTTAQTAFMPADPTTCRSIAVGTSDGWCIATCTKACPPQMCDCVGEKVPVDVPMKAAVVPPSDAGESIASNGIKVDPNAEDPSKPTNLDPGSAEYQCKVHGKCDLHSGVDPSPEEDVKLPVAPVYSPGPAPDVPALDPTKPRNLDISSSEYRCKIHGDCDAPLNIVPLPNASTVAAECRSQAPRPALPSCRHCRRAAAWRWRSAWRSASCSHEGRGRRLSPAHQRKGKSVGGRCEACSSDRRSPEHEIRISSAER